MHHSYNEYELIIPLQYSHILTSQAHSTILLTHNILYLRLEEGELIGEVLNSNTSVSACTAIVYWMNTDLCTVGGSKKAL